MDDTAIDYATRNFMYALNMPFYSHTDKLTHLAIQMDVEFELPLLILLRCRHALGTTPVASGTITINNIYLFIY